MSGLVMETSALNSAYIVGVLSLRAGVCDNGGEM